MHVQNLSEWLLFNANSTIFQLYQGEYRLNFNGMMTRPALYQTNTLSWICYSASSLKQQSADRHVASLGQISRFQANQSLVFFLNAACLAEKQQNTNSIVFDFTRPWLELNIYHTRREHANHYTTNAVCKMCNYT